MFADCEFGAERVVLVVQLGGTGGRRRFDDVLEVKKSTDFPAREAWRRSWYGLNFCPKFDDSTVQNHNTPIYQQTTIQDACRTVSQNDPTYSEVDDATNPQNDEGAGMFEAVTSVSFDIANKLQLGRGTNWYVEGWLKPSQ